MSKMYDLLKTAEARMHQKKIEYEQATQRAAHGGKLSLATAERKAKERRLQSLELANTWISAKAIVAPACSAKVRTTERVTFIRPSFPGLDRTYRGYLAVILLVIGTGFLVAVPQIFEKNPGAAQFGDNTAPVSVTTAYPVSTVQIADDQARTAAKERQPVEPEIRQMVMQWAKAWSRRDAAAYLSFYAADFNTPQNVPKAAWEVQRQSRLRKYRSIEVTLNNINISHTGSDTANVRFAQDFRADRYEEMGTPKELLLKKSQGRWFIVSERSLE
jgi:ketosteroid isomerase-like protein